VANAAKLVKSNKKAFDKKLKEATKMEVYVGVPSAKASRPDDGGVNNAQIAFTHDRGSPANNIPARPFMAPGIARVAHRVGELLKKAANAVMNPTKPASPDAMLTAAGFVAEESIKGVIMSGIGPPLSPATIANRHRKRGGKMRQAEKDYANHIAGGMSPAKAQEAAGILPLIDTGQMLNSITHVVRK
jgi:hypothetical protein